MQYNCSASANAVHRSQVHLEMHLRYKSWRDAKPEGSTGVTRLLPATHRLCAVLLRPGLQKADKLNSAWELCLEKSPELCIDKAPDNSGLNLNFHFIYGSLVFYISWSDAWDWHVWNWCRCCWPKGGMSDWRLSPSFCIVSNNEISNKCTSRRI